MHQRKDLSDVSVGQSAGWMSGSEHLQNRRCDASRPAVVISHLKWSKDGQRVVGAGVH